MAKTLIDLAEFLEDTLSEYDLEDTEVTVHSDDGTAWVVSGFDVTKDGVELILEEVD